MHNLGCFFGQCNRKIGDITGFNGDIMGFNGNIMGFNGDIMGLNAFRSSRMVISCGIIMVIHWGYHGDLMGMVF
jgi:hypothetical protein